MTDSSLADEQPMATVYPSVASLGAGRALGALYDSIPVRIGNVKLSNLLFTLPSAPVAMALYVWLKVAGERYALTTHRLRIVTGLSAKPVAEVPLDEVGRVDVVTSFGQRFYKAGDLVVHDHLGNQRLRLRGVVRPEMLRETILDARDSLVRTEAARRTIEARRPSDAGAA